MMQTNGLMARLADGRLQLTLAEFGDGMRGVALFKRGANTPIERIALAPWHVDQDEGKLVFADRNAAPGWYYRVFGCDCPNGRLAAEAREILQEHCRAHEAAILAWCNGNVAAVLPALAHV